MRIPALLLVAASLSFAEQGQGPAEPGATVDGLRLGTYWYGKKIGLDDLKGKVVLVEIWGS